MEMLRSLIDYSYFLVCKLKEAMNFYNNSVRIEATYPRDSSLIDFSSSLERLR